VFLNTGLDVSAFSDLLSTHAAAAARAIEKTTIRGIGITV
jgi:hypothetical protein